MVKCSILHASSWFSSTLARNQLPGLTKDTGYYKPDKARGASHRRTSPKETRSPVAGVFRIVVDGLNLISSIEQVPPQGVFLISALYIHLGRA